MKVLQVVSDTNIGGAGKVVLNLLGSMDIDCKVVVPKGSRLVPEIKALGRDAIEAEGIADRSISLLGIWAMLKIFRKEKPDIVHTHAGLSARIAAKLMGIKVVITRHWVGKVQRGKFLNNFLCDYAIGVSEDVAHILKLSGIAEGKVVVIENAIRFSAALSDYERLIARKKFGIDREIAIGIAARLEEVKGHKYFLEAARSILSISNNVCFVIAGDGSLAQELKAEAADMPEVKFAGFVNDIKSFFSAIDIHVLASREEAFSLAVLEAMAVGRPNVATKCGGITNKLTDGKDAFLVDFGDSDAMAEKLLRLINDKDLRRNMGLQGEKLAKNQYSAEKMAEDTLAVYQRLMKGC